jgi:16S rRNA (cytidine1402-2'-O)-methyltransferase
MEPGPKGVLYLCATPIGNLEDITLRVLRVLKEVDLIAAEDTRHTRKLLSHYDIHTPLTSYHEHNRHRKGEYLLERLLAGQNVALVSDAGTPGVSDPGEELVRAALEQGITVVPLPGPSAFLPALTVSGLPSGRFVFEGFLPKKNKERQMRLSLLAGETRTIVLYEAPHRLLKTLDQFLNVLGDRRACAARELTKRFEEIHRGTISQLRDYFSANPPRGEFVLVIEGKTGAGEDSGTGREWNFLAPEEHVELLTREGLHPNEAIKKVARLRNIPRRDLYKLVNKEKTKKT